MSLPGPAAALCAAGLFALVRAAAVPTVHIEGPPPGHTGGFGEPTCATCHFGAPLNEPGAALKVIGLDDGYRPGRRHAVTIRFESFDMLAAGFQGAFRFQDDGELRGTRAGEVRPLDDRVTTVRTDDGTDGGPEYVQHTRAGSASTDGIAEWNFEWRAPESTAPIALHIAANSGSGDDSPLDDLVYTHTVTLTPADPTKRAPAN